MKSEDCKKCKWNDDCVNIDYFEDGDCLCFQEYDGEQDDSTDTLRTVRE